MGVQKGHEATLSLSEVFRRLQDWKAVERLHREFLVSVEGQLDGNDARLEAHMAALNCAMVAQGRDQEAETKRLDSLSEAQRAAATARLPHYRERTRTNEQYQAQGRVQTA